MVEAPSEARPVAHLERQLHAEADGVKRDELLLLLLRHLLAAGQHLVNQVLEILLAVGTSVGGECGVGDAASVEQPRDACEHAKVAPALGKEREGMEMGLGVMRREHNARPRGLAGLVAAARTLEDRRGAHPTRSLLRRVQRHRTWATGQMWPLAVPHEVAH